MVSKPAGRRPVGRPRKLPEDIEAFTIRLPADVTLILRYRALSERKSINDLLNEILVAWSHKPANKKFRALIPGRS